MTRVKICGCRSIEAALAAAEAGADFIGLMFAESPRHIETDVAADIVRALGAPLRDLELVSPPGLHRAPDPDLTSWFQHGATALERLLERKRPLTVGVFADNDPEEINEIADEVGIDLIQFSGREPWGACLLANRQVIRAVHVATDDNAASAMGRMETGSAMAVLLDCAHDTLLGGTGRAFDWSVAAEIAGTMPVWLAGGLDPNNVTEAMKRVRPWAVDVSTGVETDRVKDLDKIRAFVKAAKAANS